MKPNEIRPLIGLAEQGKIRDLAIYAEKMQVVSTIEEGIAVLKKDMLKISLGSGQDFTVVARWQSWAKQKQQQFETDLIEAAYIKEEYRKIAVKSAARVQALEILLKKALKEQLILHRRRAEQNGVSPDA